MKSLNKRDWSRVNIKVTQGGAHSGIKRTFQNQGNDANVREEDGEVELGKQTETHPRRSLLESVKHFRKTSLRSFGGIQLDGSIWLTNQGLKYVKNTV